MSTAGLLRIRSPIAAALSLVTVLTACPSATATNTSDPEDSGQCVHRFELPTPSTEADDILEGRIDVGPFDPVDLGLDLSWREDPYKDKNWRFRLHSMRWLEVLRKSYRATEDARYLDIWRSFWQDWVGDNPVDDPASPAAWAHHPTGLRAKLLACAFSDHPDETWILPLLRTHANLLVRDDFYVQHGNHALNQAQGLFAAGCVVQEQSWIDLGLQRIDALVAESITPDGATNEGAIAYARYNFARYDEALERIEACDQPVPPLLRERLPMLATFMAHSALPNGEIPLIGDANAKGLPDWFGPEVVYATTLGADGHPPEHVSRIYPDGGWAFGRTSWDREAMPDSVVYALRTGHASHIHSHDDIGHLSVFGQGRRLIEDSGLFAYSNPLNRYFYGPRAHNGIVVTPGTYRRRIGSQLAWSRSTDAYDAFVLDLTTWGKVRWVRRIVFSRQGGWFLVDDQLVSLRKPRTFTQVWHLTPGAKPLVQGHRIRTRFASGNAAITFLSKPPEIEIVRGRRESPMQGFIALKFGTMTPSPVVEASTPSKARSTRFVTLISTHDRSKLPTVKDLSIDREQVAATISSGGRREALRWVGDEIRLDCVAGC